MALRSAINSNQERYGQILIEIAIYDVDPRTHSTAPASNSQPMLRGFPTLIAFIGDEPRLGWEGFAATAPQEIQQSDIIDVLEQGLAELACTMA